MVSVNTHRISNSNVYCKHSDVTNSEFEFMNKPCAALVCDTIV